MLLSLRGRMLPILTQLCKESTPICRQSLSAAVALGCYRRPLVSPVLRLSACNAVAGLHTSSQWQKKRQREERPFRIMVQNQRQGIKKTPKPAFILTCVGAVPFVFAPISMSLTGFYSPELAKAQVLYGACIMSFLGGVRWGVALPEDSLVRPNWSNLLTGVLYPGLAIVCMLSDDSVASAFLCLGMGFVYSLVLEIAGVKFMDVSPITPIWYLWLRGLLTVVAMLSFMATFSFMSFYPEQSSSKSQVKNMGRTDGGSD